MIGTIAVLIIGSVLAISSVYFRGRAFVQLGAALVGVLWTARILTTPHHGSGWRNLPKTGALVLFGILGLSLIPLPPAMVRILSPRSYALFQTALPGWPETVPFAELFSSLEMPPVEPSWNVPAPSNWRPLSTDPFTTATSLLAGVSYLVVGGAIAFYPWRRGGHEALLRITNVLVGLGAFQAVYGIYQYTNGMQRIFWFECPTACLGTYRNPDHYAGLLEMILPLCIARATLWRVNTRFDHGKRHIVAKLDGTKRWLFDELSNPALARMSAEISLGVLILVALAISNCRSAFAAVVASMAIMIPLRPRNRSGDGLRSFGPAALVGVAAMTWLSFPGFRTKLGLGDAFRARITADSFEMVRDFPIFGVGLGNFSSVFSLYRGRTNDAYAFGVSDVHNDYLQWAVETGAPAALLAFALIAGFARHVHRALRAADLPNDGSSTPAILRWGYASAALALLLHSFTDFNLHIPANALVFSVLLGGLVRLCPFSANVEPRRSELETAVSRRRFTATLGMFSCLLWAKFTLNLFGAETAYREVYPDSPLRDLVSAPSKLTPNDELQLVQRASSEFPSVPRFQSGLGYELVNTGWQSAKDSAEATRVLSDAMRAYVRSLWAAPLQPAALLGVISAADPIYFPDPGTEPGLLFDLAKRAGQLAPYNIALRLDLADWYFSQWESLPAPARAEVEQHVASTVRYAERLDQSEKRRNATAATLRDLLGGSRHAPSPT